MRRFLVSQRSAALAGSERSRDASEAKKLAHPNRPRLHRDLDAVRFAKRVAIDLEDPRLVELDRQLCDAPVGGAVAALGDRL